MGPRNMTPIIRQAITRVRQVSSREKARKVIGRFNPAPLQFELGGEHRQCGMGQARSGVACVNNV